MGTNKKTPNGRVFHLSKREAYPIIEQYFRSGLLPREFWEKVGWSDNQFYSWRKRYMEEYHIDIDSESTPEFHPVSVITDTPSEKEIEMPQTSIDGVMMEITYPNGVVLRCPSPNINFLRDLIKLY